MATKFAALLALVLVMSIALAGCGGGGGGQPAASGGNVQAGQAVFQQNCNGCHPGGAQGTGPNLKGRNLAAGQIKNQVRNGKGAMPAFPANRISDQQLNDLVAYVQSLK